MAPNLQKIDDRYGDQLLELPAPGQWKGVIPEHYFESEAYWQGCREHKLRILRCEGCGNFVHTPRCACPNCQSTDLTPTDVSGKGTVHTFSVVLRPFAPGLEAPYVVALVDLAEQPGLRMMTNIVNCTVREVEIDLPVRVVFYDALEDVTIPYFEPDKARGERHA